MSEQRMTNNRPAAAEMETSIDLIEMLYRLLASWKLILCLALIGALGAGYYTERYITPTYSATSTLYVVSSKDSVVSMSDLSLGSALASDFIKVFSTWEVHEEVISSLGLPYTYRQMQGMISVTNPANTRMLDIKVTSTSAQEAATIANEYAKVGSQYIADVMSTTKPSIMSVALVPANPNGPNKTRNIMMGFLAGAALAAGIVVLRMLMDDKIKTAEDIRKYTGMVTLAILPVEESLNGKNHKKSKRRKA